MLKSDMLLPRSTKLTYIRDIAILRARDGHATSTGGVRPMIAKHAGRNRKTAHLYHHRRRVHIKLL